MGDRDEAMIEALRRAYEAFNRGDYDAVLELARPDIQYTRTGVEAPLTGTEALRAWMEPDAFDRQQTDPLSFEVNGSKVLVRQRFSARGAEKRDRAGRQLLGGLHARRGRAGRTGGDVSPARGSRGSQGRRPLAGLSAEYLTGTN